MDTDQLYSLFKSIEDVIAKRDKLSEWWWQTEQNHMMPAEIELNEAISNLKVRYHELEY